MIFLNPSTRYAPLVNSSQNDSESISDFFKLPNSIWENIVKNYLPLEDTVQFSQVCKFTKSITLENKINDLNLIDRMVKQHECDEDEALQVIWNERLVNRLFQEGEDRPKSLNEIKEWFENPENRIPLDFTIDLNLSDLHLKVLPSQITKFRRLHILRLDNNQLSRLPESISDLTMLHSLRLDNNQLSKLPKSFGKLWNLRSLRLENNQLLRLPESFGEFDGLNMCLKELSLNNNKLSTLPESFSKLKFLQRLDLSNNQLENLTDSFGSFPCLCMLYLNNNELTLIPESLGKFNQLQILDLSHNKLSRLSKSIGNLPELQHLFINNNNFTTIPELKNKNQLQRFSVQNNPIKNLACIIS